MTPRFAESISALQKAPVPRQADRPRRSLRSQNYDVGSALMVLVAEA